MIDTIDTIMTIRQTNRITLTLFSNKQFLNLLIKVDFLRHCLAQVNVLKRLQAETDVVQGMKGSTNVELLR